ncbi:phosphatidylinositol-glycan biosynthesis class X protein [Leptinotarsa decemlineata]|uniref:phosphatidylinositol-glycan biosynthesis class X protein n=1 Tax=Leptinotarsa decemlineata TaxID=7539 RepID=UPI003D304CC3
MIMIIKSSLILSYITLSLISYIECESECLNLEISIIRKVEHEGFHRNVLWLIESPLTKDLKTLLVDSKCTFVLRQDIPNGMFVNPDEIAELSRKGKLVSYIDGSVDIEAPAHEAKSHILYIYLSSTGIEKTSIAIPIHLRYQRSQISGRYAKVMMLKPSLLSWCPGSLNKVCGKGLKVEAPCDNSGKNVCIWKNLTYQALFDEVELYVPVGDLDDYPLVSILTLLLGCAGCIYTLSVLSTTPL